MHLFLAVILLYKIYYATIRSRAKKSSRQISNFMFYGSNLRVLISASAHEPVYREYKCTRDIQVAYLRAPLVMLLESVDLEDKLTEAHFFKL
jgi:hypothetical protein